MMLLLASALMLNVCVAQKTKKAKKQTKSQATEQVKEPEETKESEEIKEPVKKSEPTYSSARRELKGKDKRYYFEIGTGAGLGISMTSQTAETGLSIPLELSYCMNGWFMLTYSPNIILTRTTFFTNQLLIRFRVEEGLFYSQFGLGGGLATNQTGSDGMATFDVAIGVNLSRYLAIEMLANMSYTNISYNDYVLGFFGLMAKYHF